MSFRITFLSEPGYEIEPFLFTAPDASLHVSDFLNNDIYKGFGGYGTINHTVANWTEFCYGESNIVLGYGPFLGCLLYPNVTRNVQGGDLPSNLTNVGYGLDDGVLPRRMRSRIPTCLIAYCAAQPDCASTDACDLGNLLTGDYSALSAQGVGNCWKTLCSLNVQSLDADIAGVGILISYLIQTTIAVIGFISLSALAIGVWWQERRLAASSGMPAAAGHHKKSLERIRYHWGIITSVLSDFHKAQCYLSIALQIAALAIIFGNRGSLSYNDKNFLLLVGLDGLIPIVLTLYTLMSFSRRSWYMLALSFVTVLLASVQGGYIVTQVLLPVAEGGAVSIDSAGGDWPAACGNIGPSALCAGTGPNTSGYADAARDFMAAMVCLDVVLALLILWKLNDTKLAQALVSSMSLFRRPRFQRAIEVGFHCIVAITVLGCVCLEYYYFELVFTSPFVNFQSWSFGQIVGITTWAAVLVEFAYLQHCGLIKGSKWRLPRWFHVSKSAANPPASRPGNTYLSVPSHEAGEESSQHTIIGHTAKDSNQNVMLADLGTTPMSPGQSIPHRSKTLDSDIHSSHGNTGRSSTMPAAYR